MTEQVIRLLVNLAETGIFYYMISHCLTWKYHDLRKYICIPAVLAALTLCDRMTTRTILPLVLSLLTPLIVEVAVVFILTCGRYPKKLFWGCLFPVLSFASQKLILISSCLAIDHNLENLNRIHVVFKDSATKYWNEFIYLIFLTVLIFVIVHLKEHSPLFPKYTLALLLWITLLGMTAAEALIAVVIELEYSNGYVRYFEYFSSLYFIAVYFLAIFVLSFIFITFIGIMYRRNLTLQGINKQYSLEKEQYKMLDETNKVLRAWRHENMNHLQTILQLGENKQYEEAGQYIHQLIEDIHLGTTGVHTGNYAVDAIISTKQFEADEKGIRFTHELFLPDESLLPLDNVLLSSLLGNMLNNAIEASAMTDAPFMHLTMKTIKSTLLIELKNSSKGVYAYNSEQQLRSMKKEKEHGIGLKRIADIVRTAEGFYQIQPESDSFLISVVLPLKNEPGESLR